MMSEEDAAMKRCFQVNPEDNVATLLQDAEPGPAAILGSSRNATVDLLEEIKLGHKVCTHPASKGDLIVKYGVPIGVATEDIPIGAWVHLHNCSSRVDERSNHLDVKTGVAKDVDYA
jgi:hypothetical protein